MTSGKATVETMRKEIEKLKQKESRAADLVNEANEIGLTTSLDVDDSSLSKKVNFLWLVIGAVIGVVVSVIFIMVLRFCFRSNEQQRLTRPNSGKKNRSSLDNTANDVSFRNGIASLEENTSQYGSQ